MISFLEKEIENIPVINEDKRYWFIRTYGGETFENYYDNKYVGLGINNVPVNLIKDARVIVKSPASFTEEDNAYEILEDTKGNDVMENRSAFIRLWEHINQNTSYHFGEATKAAVQLVNFENNIKIGDTVIIPSKNSSQIAIGTIESDVFSVRTPATFYFKNETHQYPIRRRRVKWERLIDKKDLQGDFRGITSRQGLTNIDYFKDIIDGTSKGLYIRNAHAYLTLKINQDQEINAFVLNRFLSGLTYFYQEFCKESGREIDENLTIKIRLQSKGKMGIIGTIVVGVAGISGMLHLGNRPDVRMEMGTYHSINASDSYMDFYNQFINHSPERIQKAEEFNTSMQQLKAMNYLDSLPATEHDSSDETEIVGE